MTYLLYGRIVIDSQGQIAYNNNQTNITTIPYIKFLRDITKSYKYIQREHCVDIRDDLKLNYII